MHPYASDMPIPTATGEGNNQVTNELDGLAKRLAHLRESIARLEDRLSLVLAPGVNTVENRPGELAPPNGRPPLVPLSNMIQERQVEVEQLVMRIDSIYSRIRI